MYVRRKRKFVKRKASCIGSTSWVADSIGGKVAERMAKLSVGVALIIAVAIAVPVAFLVLRPYQVMLFHVDPELQETLMLGEPTYAYISMRAGTDIGLKPTKVWRFGDLVIEKVRLSSINQLHSIMGRKGVMSIYGEKEFRHAPLYWFDVSGYPFRKYDADNRLHKAFGSWCGRNVTVAIIDTGIDYTHPDFYDKNNRSVIKVLVSMLYVTPAGQNIIWIPYVNGTMDDLLNYDMQLWKQYGEPAFLDINGHGTHCAGIVAGRGWASNGTYVGIAPCTELVIIKAFNKNGEASLDVCLSAIEWVWNNTERYGIKILSLSWGAAFASDGNDPLSLAVDELVEKKGVWVFAAVGNEGNYPTTVVVPAVAKDAFAVGAWDPYYDKVAPFSSLGPTIDLRMKPDFMGAGVMVVSCKSAYADFPDEYKVGEYYVALSGTSMSTPAVAGVAADFIEYFRYWHHRDPAINDFLRYVEDNGRHIDFVKDFITGWGIPIAPHAG